MTPPNRDEQIAVATEQIESGARLLASLGVSVDAIKQTLDDAFWIANDVIEGRRPRTGYPVKGGTQMELPRSSVPRPSVPHVREKRP